VQVGLDNSGKSTILYKMALGETINTQVRARAPPMRQSGNPPGPA
jgi:hypothetical protein